ncbi:hypothetical protein OFD71_42555, partial [Escherichia coli]|nr:hypothetical protein [Escherichia coli]
RKRRIRVQRTLIAFAIYAALSVIQMYRISRGLADPWLGSVLIGVVLAASSIFYLATRTGWSERFADPALTLPQMLFGMPA